MNLDNKNTRKLLILLGQIEASITEKQACNWLYKRYQTSKKICVQCLFALKEVGLITYQRGQVKATEKGREQVKILLEQEEQSQVTLSAQQKIILQEILSGPKTVEALRLRCFRELGLPHGSIKAVSKALKQLKDRGLATTVGTAPLKRWVATEC